MRGIVQPCEPVSSKGKRASARNTMAPAKPSTAAVTFRNNRGPYHETGENRRIAKNCNNRAECSNGYRQKNLGNCLHLVPNSRQHLAPRSYAHLAAHGEAHTVAIIRGHLGDANTGQISGQLATFKSATSRLHLRPTRVSNNNTGARLFILYTFKRRLIIYSLHSQDAINSLLLTTTKCN